MARSTNCYCGYNLHSLYFNQEEMRMKDLREFFAVFIVGLAAGLLIMVMATRLTMVPKKTVIEHGCAEYNSVTSKFQFKGKSESR